MLHITVFDFNIVIYLPIFIFVHWKMSREGLPNTYYFCRDCPTTVVLRSWDYMTLWRLITDLTICYKIVFGLTCLKIGDFCL